jgi:tetratricopeptide (TPR) repeat protein
MEQLKSIGDDFFNENMFEKAIEKYTLALDFDSDDKYKIYLNRCLSFYKLKKYNKALSDAIKATRLKPDNAKTWGRLGSCLGALGRNSQSIYAFKKAYELEPLNENYKIESKKKLDFNDSDTEDEDEDEDENEDKYKYENNDSETEDEDSNNQNIHKQDIFSLTKNIKSIMCTDENNIPNVIDTMMNNKMVDNMFNKILSNDDLINKISDQNFQNKMLSYQFNPLEAFKDQEIMSLMNSVLGNMNVKDFTKNKDL